MKTGYNEFILQSVESDEEMLSNEWKSLKWDYFKHSIFKIQKRIFKAEKEGNYRKVNRLSRLLVNDKRSLLYAINVVTKKNKGKRTGGVDDMVIKTDSERMALFYKLKDYKIRLYTPKPVRRIYIPKKMVRRDPWGFRLSLIEFIKKFVNWHWNQFGKPNLSPLHMVLDHIVGLTML